MNRHLLLLFVSSLLLSDGLAGSAEAGGEEVFAAMDFGDFRRELRAFYPDECHQPCKDPRQTNSVAKIGAALDAWAAQHPGYDALDVRREEYLQVRTFVQPFLFRTSPFYFELGVNGGWSNGKGWETVVPGRHVNRLCQKFYREQNLIPDAAFALQNARQGLTLALCCGPFVDDMHHLPPFRTILKKGFGGVRADVAAALAKCPADDPHGRKELETALVGLDTIHEIQLAFKREADARLAAGVADAAERRRLERISESAARCPWEPPRTFFEGLNTLWFVREALGYVDGTCQFSLGRPDHYFIDLYRADLAAGRLTVAEARELVAKFLLTAELHHDGTITLDSYNDHEMEIPMTLGGCDEKGNWVHNELTDMFFDAHLGVGCVFPKMHCRIASDAPQAYLKKIAHHLMKGHAVYTLLNDDRFVKQFVDEGYPVEDARSHIGCGCWNGMIDSVMDYSGGNYLSIAKILEMTIHRDDAAAKRARLVLDPLDGATSYEQVRETLYRNTIRFLRDILGEYRRWGRANAKVFPHPVYTMCLRGGVESRRDTTEGGIKAQPRIITLGFLGNVVDSLLSIRQLCFVDKACTLDELLAAVRSDWKGPRGEELRLRAIAAPSWGDNSALSNGEFAWWLRRVNADVADLRSEQDYPWKFAVYTYREFLYWGLRTKATPDGRHTGDRLAQGFTPSEFRCRSDMTTVINSIGSLPHECLYASNANLTFDRSAMNEDRLATILRVFAQKGAHMIQPNCNSVEELLDAQKHPELHQNLVVRVCGFSARFVALSKRWQDEIIARHRLK
jgi:pyruvate-formate lyase